MAYEPLHHKYRPTKFSELVGQEAIAKTLSNALRQQRIAPAYLFAGPRGTGKTSSARILAKSLNCLKTDKPTDDPCGVCKVCRSIVDGSSLDVVEIDAASNTGVDNIRDLIERAQFAPMECRYKLYIIDECLTGDTLVRTRDGLVRIDDRALQGREVLSYNEASQQWEFKKVVRWLDRGSRETLTIQTSDREIQCTGNHLVRTTTGWISAKNIMPGMQILSPKLASEMTPRSQFLPRLVNSATVNIGQTISNDRAATKPTTVTSSVTIQEIARNPVSQRINSNLVWLWTRNRVSTPLDARIPECLPSNNLWHTNLETVKSVRRGGVENVYDIEVEDNHNFVANGLLVHNCHMLSTAAFNSLLKTLEEPPPRIVFVLATTDPQRVLPTIISRCQRFDYRRIPLEAMVSHLKIIADKESIDIVDEAVTLVAQVAQGGLRDAESLLDQLSLLPDRVTSEQVWDLVGAVPERDLMELLEAIASDNAEAVLDRSRHLLDRGKEPLTVLQNLAGFYRDLLIAKTAPNRSDLVAVTPPTWEKMCAFAHKWDTNIILAGGQHLRACEAQIKNTTQPRLWLEMSLLGLLPSAIVAPQNPVSPPRNVAPPPSPSPTPQPRSQPPRNVAPPPSPSPTPQPQPQTPVPAPPPATGETSDLESIWQQVLSRIPRDSTRALLNQQARLIAWENDRATLGFKSAGLLKLGGAKLPEIEAAFQATFQKTIAISLEVASKNGKQPASPPAKSAPSPAPVSTPAPAAPTVESSTQTAPPATTSPPETVATPPPVSQNGTAPDPVVLPPENSIPPSPPEAQSQVSITETDGDPEEVERAARQLAEFFNGEVVNMDLDF